MIFSNERGLIADPENLSYNAHFAALLRNYVDPTSDGYLEAIIPERDAKGRLVWLQPDGRLAAR